MEQIESEADVLETVVPEPDDDAVRILTVHGSKGLEFPITILAGLGIAPRTGAEVFWGGGRPEARLKGGDLETEGYAARTRPEKELDLAESVGLLYVATTRAKDHLVIGCYHNPPQSSDTPSHGQQVWDLLGGSALVNVEPTPPAQAAPDAEPVAETAVPSDREEFLSAREELLAGVRARVAVSATSLVSAAEAESVADEFDPEAGAPQPSARLPQRMPARTGAAIGSAVHAVLELVDLNGWTEQEVTAISALVCQRLDIPQLVNGVSIRVRNALTARLAAEAGASGRCWREVYVVSHDGQRYVEGYVDLLVQGDDGLTIVDYKTDRVRTDADREAKARHYRPQLRAYADALGRVPGVHIDKAALLFLSGDGPIEVPIDVFDPRSAGRGRSSTWVPGVKSGADRLGVCQKIPSRSLDKLVTSWVSCTKTSTTSRAAPRGPTSVSSAANKASRSS